MYRNTMEKSYVIVKDVTELENVTSDTASLSVALDRDVAVELVDKYAQSFERRHPKYKGKGQEYGVKHDPFTYFTYGIMYEDFESNELIAFELRSKPTYDKGL